MISRRFLLPLCAALLLSAASAQTTCPPRGPMMPQEARLMDFSDMQKATAGKTEDQVREYRHAQREKFMSMSEADRAKHIADLTKRFKALPPAEQNQLTEAFDIMRKNHPWGGGEHGGQGGGHGPDNCPPPPPAH
jgi:hypothetical protein